jgi:hypothetical protein
MTNDLRVAEQLVEHLIAETNRNHEDSWRYELTSRVDNIEVASEGGMCTLRIHPCWLRYVVSQGDFKFCVADEINAWYLLAQLVDEMSTVA